MYIYDISIRYLIIYYILYPTMTYIGIRPHTESDINISNTSNDDLFSLKQTYTQLCKQFKTLESEYKNLNKARLDELGAYEDHKKASSRTIQVTNDELMKIQMELKICKEKFTILQEEQLVQGIYECMDVCIRIYVWLTDVQVMPLLYIII